VARAVFRNERITIQRNLCVRGGTRQQMSQGAPKKRASERPQTNHTLLRSPFLLPSNSSAMCAAFESSNNHS
jgi:hypothetical protein